MCSFLIDKYSKTTSVLFSLCGDLQSKVGFFAAHVEIELGTYLSCYF